VKLSQLIICSGSDKWCVTVVLSPEKGTVDFMLLKLCIFVID
jgi:hypothetical protein